MSKTDTSTTQFPRRDESSKIAATVNSLVRPPGKSMGTGSPTASPRSPAGSTWTSNPLFPALDSEPSITWMFICSARMSNSAATRSLKPPPIFTPPMVQRIVMADSTRSGCSAARFWRSDPSSAEKPACGLNVPG